MSSWIGIEAHFQGSIDYVSLDYIKDGAPEGSEGGCDFSQSKSGSIFVHGRLRDRNDYDTPGILAWFATKCENFCDKGDLRIDVDFGPRYRWEWKDNQLTKLKGILDQ